MKIIIVDSSRAMRRMFARTVRMAGFEDCEFVEVESACEALDAACQGANLIVANWSLPDMTAVEMMTTLNNRGFEIPVGFLTAESSQSIVEQATEAGAMFLITKPFTSDDLAQVMGMFY